MVCGLFAVFWLSFGVLQLPEWQIAASYSVSGTNASEGAISVGYNAAIALYLIVWGFSLFTFFVFTLRTNMVFAMIFFFVDVGVWLLTAAYWKVAAGDFTHALKLQKVIYSKFPVSDRELLMVGWWGDDVHCCAFGVVYDCCDDVCRIACYHKVARRGFITFLA
jgi:hypothetical protein